MNKRTCFGAGKVIAISIAAALLLPVASKAQLGIGESFTIPPTTRTPSCVTTSLSSNWCNSAKPTNRS